MTAIDALVPEQLWQAIQWRRLRQLLLDELGCDGRLGWSRASLDSLSVRAKRGAA